MKSSILFMIFKKNGGEQWESTTNTAEFVGPADVIFFKKGRK